MLEQVMVSWSHDHNVDLHLLCPQSDTTLRRKTTDSWLMLNVLTCLNKWWFIDGLSALWLLV